jgi:hypothetical protein
MIAVTNNATTTIDRIRSDHSINDFFLAKKFQITFLRKYPIIRNGNNVKPTMYLIRGVRSSLSINASIA